MLMRSPPCSLRQHADGSRGAGRRSRRPARRHRREIPPERHPPVRARLHRAEHDVADLDVLPELGEVRAHEGEVMALVEVSDLPDAVEVDIIEAVAGG